MLDNGALYFEGGPGASAARQQVVRRVLPVGSPLLAGGKIQIQFCRVNFEERFFVEIFDMKGKLNAHVVAVEFETLSWSAAEGHGRVDGKFGGQRMRLCRRRNELIAEPWECRQDNKNRNDRQSRG